MSNFFFTLGVAGILTGGPFTMQPRDVTITRTASIAEFQFSSLSAQPRIFDVRVMRWTQRNGQNVLTPAPGFIVVPSVFSIDPYQTVLVRVEPRGNASPSTEQSYKVVLTRVVPGAAAPPQNARRLEAALFVPPAKPAVDPTFTLKSAGPQRADLVVVNGGNEHIYIQNVSVADAPVAGYVLANSTQLFHLRINGPLHGTDAEVTFDDAQGRRQTARVTVSQ
ncbi:MAG TPA: fimbria/pilus periplasmic chaperone [Candidatus Baltobacteraceae bacterium]|nr:fimbria/pilus periplasmic chaperone [Candidatus Baltobacteraceae bacterium]